MKALVHVVASHPGLRHRLSLELRAALEWPVACSAPPLRSLQDEVVVVTPTTNCSTGECRRLADLGALVVVLAALPFEEERQRYLAAGAAAYIVMEAGSTELADVVAGLLSEAATRRRTR